MMQMVEMAQRMVVGSNGFRARRRSLIGGFLAALLLAAAGLLVLEARPAHAATLTVTNTNDSGAGSLRQAIEDANNNGAGADTINFAIPGNGPHTIAPTSALPVITSTVIIDGYSQGKSTKNTTSDDAKPNTLAEGDNAVLKIELSGANAGPGANGLEIRAANSTVKGLIINRWSNYGVLIDGPGAKGNKVQGNYIGTDASGTSITDASDPTKKLGNLEYGVRIEGAPNNTVGGTTAAARNIISGNNSSGVYISDAGAKGNKVMGNYIGTDKSGTLDLGNSEDGVTVFNAPNNTVGGTPATARNIISGNDQSGVYIHNAGATANKVQGNYIGTDASGTSITDASDPTKKLGNLGYGVRLDNAPNNTVGGTTAAARNLISGNDHGGVYIVGTGAKGNKVMGNYIGTDASGTVDLGNYIGVAISDAPNNTVGGTVTRARNIISGNDYSGVFIYGTEATGNKVMGNYIGTDKSGTLDLGNSRFGVGIGASNNTVGGTTAAARNIISGNDYSGVFIYGTEATGNSILSNSIFSNGGLGIDLSLQDLPPDGRTTNDGGSPPDQDSGPNNLQNFPELSSATTTTITAQLNSTPNKTFIIQFFSNPASQDEGKKLLGSKQVSTDTNGNASISFSKSIPAGAAITATATLVTDPATGATGDTSEFSDPKTVA